MGKPVITEREFDTIIAALRMWQTAVLDDSNGVPIDLVDVASEHGTALTSSEVNELIGKLQSWA